jgi:hypothetical protein
MDSIGLHAAAAFYDELEKIGASAWADKLKDPSSIVIWPVRDKKGTKTGKWEMSGGKNGAFGGHPPKDVMELVEENLEKEAESNDRKRPIKALAGATAGMTAGYVGARYGYPALMQAMGKSAKLSPAARAILTAMAGISGAALISGIGAYSESQSQPARELRDPGAVQPADGELAVGYEGYPAEIPAGPVLPDAPWAGQLPLRADWQGRGDGRTEDGDRHHGRRKREYEYGGKETRDYHFAGPIRLR